MQITLAARQPRAAVSLRLYRVLAQDREWSSVNYVRAADEGHAVTCVRNTNQDLYNNSRVWFSVTIQDDSKGVVFRR